MHDVLNVFQVTGLNDDDKYFMKACPAKPGDYLEFFAEMDLLCALSTCPGGDLSVPMWGPEARDPIDVCRPLGVEVYALDPALLQGWTPPEVSPYKGVHGLHLKGSSGSKREKKAKKDTYPHAAPSACCPPRGPSCLGRPGGKNTPTLRLRLAAPRGGSLTSGRRSGINERRGQTAALFYRSLAIMPAERDSGISIAERISHQLRDDIMEGKLPPGTQLVEVDLAADYGASRNTIREVLHQLGREGLATFIRHKGVVVRRMERKDLREIYAARRALELQPSPAGCRCSRPCSTRCTPLSTRPSARCRKDNGAASAR